MTALMYAVELLGQCAVRGHMEGISIAIQSLGRGGEEGKAALVATLPPTLLLVATSMQLLGNGVPLVVAGQSYAHTCSAW